VHQESSISVTSPMIHSQHTHIFVRVSHGSVNMSCALTDRNSFCIWQRTPR